MPSRRTALKWLHWVGFCLILYFYLVEPDENDADPGGALSTHAGVGALLALLVVIWTVMYLRKGLASRPGPKLPPLAKTAHPWMHRALYLGMPVMMLYVVRAFGLVPMGTGNGTKSWNYFFEDMHELAFNVLIAMIVAHAAFHLWRHFWLKDNALRIMVPKLLHKWL